ncbi:patatin-like phospholipase [Salegentibacter sp. 24]|nr:patatin-like phospholipase [Salegentibacter sp. 24]
MEKNAAFAARCSMSIPIFFTPQYSEGLRVFDGGAQNNFPVKVLLDKYPDTNFLGLYLGAEIYKHEKKNFLGDMLSIWTESSDPDVLREYKNNIVVIDPDPISTTQFKLSSEEKEFLLESGRLAAIKFLDKTNIIKKTDLNFESRKNDLELLREKLKTKKRKKKFFIKSLCLLVIFLVATYFYGNHLSF